MTDHGGTDHGAIRTFIKLDRIGATLGILVLAIMNALVVRAPAVWIIAPFLLALVAGLTLAERSIEAGRVVRALALVTSLNWLIALIVPVLLPFLWPVMIITVLMPLVLASPHLSGVQLSRFLAAGAAVAGAVAAIGLLNDDGGAIEDIADEAELILVIGSLAAQIVPIGLIVWQHNNLQRKNLAELATLNDDLVRSEAELAASRRRVVDAADTERRRIERDLHDGAQQRLVAIGVHLRLLENAASGDDDTKHRVSSLVGDLEEALTEIRDLSHGIYPPLLQTQGLGPALTAVARRSLQPVVVKIQDVERMDQSREAALYFTALEALANASKHAPQAEVSLSLSEDEAAVVLTISDDGPGFSVAGNRLVSGGLQNMKDRMEVVGGTLHVTSGPVDGTTLQASVAPKRRA